ncbi:plastocyanin/azurin family copper-binding protein [Luteolibacter flavescens]|uniref:Plastocyanin/azurin family copper-binding protein n=1 Tax=Luteolibacter flavescens TaxID=1859460 RepID=A0ABT3FUK9_9BACT|nr:plastocyanin/azurin family copper-binding protein [Luteolibacter flavescens]MCW1887278.1 plastocyanin/azurin family copper-binding protein [Luteolibacter flavescens]
MTQNPSFLRLGVAAIVLPVAGVSHAAEPLVALQKGDHVAIVGGGLADRQQHHGWLEALIHRAYPELDLTVRNLGFAADEVSVRPRSADVPTTEWFLSMKKGDTSPRPGVVYKAGTDFGADVIFAYWGFNESFHGLEGLEKFKGDLGSYLDAQLSAKYNGKAAPRVVLFSPIAHENLKSPDFPDGEANNVNLALYTKAMAEVANAKGVPFVDLYTPSKELFAKAGSPLTINGIHLTEEGDRQLAPVQFAALFGKQPPSLDDAQVEKIRAAVIDKNQQWHHRYRTVDQYNIFGDRSRISYAGVTNATTLGEELAQRDVKTANRDLRVWAVAKGGDLKVTDDNLPKVNLVPPNREDNTPYLDPEEAIQHLKLAPGCKVELVASEISFPDLVNPVQMAFDTKGKLWIAAWPNYPETSPTTTNFDKLLVFDLDPKTGKAVKCTTFMDGLNCPTGFQFYKDGVLLMQSPDLWYIRDTDGDGKADTKERVLHGLDAADSHHETNSMCLEPGGAVYLSDGVFHRSSVETYDGPVRNTDGAIYRYEANTGKFTRHAPYGFANPHGRVFDYWGNDLITDATGNDNYFGPAMSGHLDSGKHPGMRQFWNRPSRPTPGTAILTSRHFPDDWQGLFLNTNVISVQGIFRAKLSEEGSGIKGETISNLIETDIAKNPNFRPSGITVAPDGSLYFMDWSQMLIGHLQHHLRDPKRDHQHGRLYRITYEGRPLLEPKKIDGEPVAKLLELLKEPENDVRMRAKIELGKRDPKEVIRGVQSWLSVLDEKDAKFEHNVLEALWVHQWHNVVDLDLLKRVLKSPDPRARAQAVRVMGYWRDRVPDALALLRVAADDGAPRVRLEAVRVASFFREWEAADVALTALKHPTDYYIDYCLKETMRQLQPWWKAAISEGKAIAADNPAGINYVLGSVSTGDLAKLPKTPVTLTAILTRPGVPLPQRQQALTDLATIQKAKTLDVLITTLAAGGDGSDDLARLLLQQPVADLKASRAGVEKLLAVKLASVRQAALAAMIAADGSVDTVWAAASKSPGLLVDFLNAVPKVADASVRDGAFDKILPLLSSFPPALEAALSGKKGEARYVRVELPRTGTLTLAEVQVFANGENVALKGSAKQSSTAFDGGAQRAIDGKTNALYESGTQTHTNEGEDSPWWELDLKSDQPVSEIAVWNRQGFEDRLDGFTLTVLDADRQEIFKKTGNPAPRLSAKVEVPHDPAAGVRAAAIRALVTMKKEPAKVFTALAKLVQSGEQVPAAAKGISQLPRDAWAKDLADPVAAALVTWAKQVPADSRTTQDFSEVVQVANELAGMLSPDRAATARKVLADLKVNVFVIKAVPEQLRYDTTEITVEPGKPFEVIFENPDLMPHNIVFVQPGTVQAVATAVQAQAPDKLDSKGRSYVPENDPRILGATKMIEAGQKETLHLTAPEKEGVYEFVCTFPGHWSVMQGKLVVKAK